LWAGIAAAADRGSGKASYYSSKYNGRLAANGERFSNNAMTAASHEYPLGTKVRVTNLANNRSTIVRVNDRGPNVKGRSISVTRRAAKELGFIKAGVADVKLEVVKNPGTH
jgi:rare lipoprotein A